MRRRREDPANKSSSVRFSYRNYIRLNAETTKREGEIYYSFKALQLAPPDSGSFYDRINDLREFHLSTFPLDAVCSDGNWICRAWAFIIEFKNWNPI